MSISQKIEKYHKNRVKNIKNMKKGSEKDLAIGSLVADLGKRSVNAVSKTIGYCRKKIKLCYDKFIYGVQLSLEFRGRKRITNKFPYLIEDIEKVIENYKNIDKSFKSETIYVSINPKAIIDELVSSYNYPEKFTCYNTVDKLLKEMGYVLHKIPKTQVLDKIPETDMIFENVNEHLEDIKYTDDTAMAISIDDKATKKIGNISDNELTRLNIKGLDYDTNFE